MMKNSWITILLLVVMAGPAFAVQRSSVDFSRYDVILNRRPFGTSVESESPAIAVVVPPKAVPASQSFIKDYRMCAIRDSVAGVSVGLVNMSVKPATSFFMYEGEEEGGIFLVEADFMEEKALLRKDAEERWIYMSGAMRAASAPRGSQTRLSSNLLGVQSIITSRLQQRRVPRIPFAGLTKEDYKIKRANGELKAPVPSRKFLRGRTPKIEGSADEREVKLRTYNMDLIRAGGEKGLPLPIPLTVEEDNQLVAEGVLPPR